MLKFRIGFLQRSTLVRVTTGNECCIQVEISESMWAGHGDHREKEEKVATAPGLKGRE